MSSIKVSKHILRGILWEDVVNDEETGDNYHLVAADIKTHKFSSRWLSHHLMVFRKNGVLYGVNYSRGLTEQQDIGPFDLDPDEVECRPVKQVTKIIEVQEYAYE